MNNHSLHNNSNWHKYFNLLQTKNIPEDKHRYYMSHVKAFLSAFPNRSIPSLKQGEIERYLWELPSSFSTTASRAPSTKQAIDAIELLLVDLCASDEGMRINWNELRASGLGSQAFESSVSHLPEHPIQNRTSSSWDLALESLIHQVRSRHYSIRTEKTYLNWCARFRGHCGVSPQAIKKNHIEAFLTHLSVERQVSASTQSLALNSIVFLCKYVLKMKTDELGFRQAKRSKKLPVVLSKQEVSQVLDEIPGVFQLMTGLLYGSGLRLMECMRLRIKDLDFDHGTIIVRNGKGSKDRIVPMPQSYRERLIQHVAERQLEFDEDKELGYHRVYIPEALARKLTSAAFEFKWHYVFAAKTLSQDPRSGLVRRHHLHETSLQRVIRNAVKKTGLTKVVSAHTFRHSFATHLLEAHYDIRTIQQLLGHTDVSTTMIYTHVMNKPGLPPVVSPADAL